MDLKDRAALPAGLELPGTTSRSGGDGFVLRHHLINQGFPAPYNEQRLQASLGAQCSSCEAEVVVWFMLKGSTRTWQLQNKPC